MAKKTNEYAPLTVNPAARRFLHRHAAWQLVVNRTHMGDISRVNDLAKQRNKGASL